MMRLQNRDNLDASIIIAGLAISMFLLPPTQSQHIDLSKPNFNPVVVSMSLFVPARGKAMSLYNHDETTEQR